MLKTEMENETGKGCQTLMVCLYHVVLFVQIKVFMILIRRSPCDLPAVEHL